MDLSLSRAAIIVMLSLMITHCRSADSDSASPKINQPSQLSGKPQATSKAARGGGGVIEGNGGEYITNEQNPWFLGAAPVLYCIVHDAAAFSTTLDQTRTAIDEGLQTWQGYFTAKGPGRLQSPFVLATKGIASLSLDFQEVPCDRDHELEFRMGVRDSEIEAALQYSADNVVALSYRKDYSDRTGRARGQIWVSADLGGQMYRGPNPGAGFWTKDHNLTNVLTHELGHVFGVRHTELGLMAADFPAKMLQFGLKPRVTSDSIESPALICGLLYRPNGPFDPEGSFLKVFGEDYENLDHACVSYDRKKATKDGTPYSFDLFLKDGRRKSFSGLLNDEGRVDSFIKGQFFKQSHAEGLHYAPFSFLSIVTSFSGQGILDTDSGPNLMTLSSYQPSTLSINIGYEGAWQKFFLIKNTLEVWGMTNLLHPARGEI